MRSPGLFARTGTALSASGPGNKRMQTKWWRCYPEITQERWRDMYHSYYPYLFDHGDKMSLYPKIPANPREWQPNQLQTTYDAVREDKYDAFMKVREKFPELYQDTHQWDNPRPYGEFNMFYSVRFGMIGTKAFTQIEYDEFGNKMELTALWCPDNQVLAHKTKEADGGDIVTVGAMNVPIEFHKPYITAAYKSMNVPVKHVSASFNVTPDAFAPVGTKLDVRHFKPGQEVNLLFQETDYGFRGVMFKHGMDGGPVWLGDSKWQRRPGGIGTEGSKRVLPGTRLPGQTGGGRALASNCPIYRIDYKNSLIYVAKKLNCDIGCYVRISDVLNIHGKVAWNANRGLPAFPTFVPEPAEDVSAMAAEDCQLQSLPLVHRMMDEEDQSSLISQQEIDDARAVKPAAPVAKKKLYDYKKFLEFRRKHHKMMRERRKKYMKTRATYVTQKQDEARRKKLADRRRVK